MRTLSEIIADAGGAPGIEEHTGGEIKRDAVYKWHKIGVVDRHWPVLIDLAGATVEEIYQANLAVRSTPERETAA